MKPDGVVSLALGNVGLIQGLPTPDLTPVFGNHGLIAIISLR
jgi:hypothetical protein